MCLLSCVWGHSFNLRCVPALEGHWRQLRALGVVQPWARKKVLRPAGVKRLLCFCSCFLVAWGFKCQVFLAFSIPKPILIFFHVPTGAELVSALWEWLFIPGVPRGEKHQALLFPLCRLFTAVELAPALPSVAIPAPPHHSPWATLTKTRMDRNTWDLEKQIPALGLMRRGRAQPHVSCGGQECWCAVTATENQRNNHAASRAGAPHSCVGTFAVCSSLCPASAVNSGGKASCFPPHF